MKYKCECCGKEFESKPSALARRDTQTCSKACRSTVKYGKCLYCNSVLEESRAKYCGTECRLAGSRKGKNRILLDPALVVDKLRAAAIAFVERSEDYFYSDVEELVNDAYVALYQGITKYALTPRKLYYQCYMAMLRVSNKKKEPTQSFDALVNGGFDVQSRHDTAVDDQDEVRYLFNNSGLTDKEKDIVKLRFKEDLRYREIGEEIGASSTTANNILNKALAKMRYSTN